MSKHGKPNEKTPAEWLRNVVLPTGGDSVVASLAAAPAASVVGQTVEGTEGVKVDGGKKKQKGVEEAQVTDTLVVYKKRKAEEVKDEVEGESTEKKKKKKAEEVAVSDADKSEKKKKR